MDLANMSTLRNVNPVEAKIGDNGDADQQDKNGQTDKEFDDLPVKRGRGQPLSQLLDMGLEKTHQRGEEECENLEGNKCEGGGVG